jgi:hypothetical protein
MFTIKQFYDKLNFHIILWTLILGVVFYDYIDKKIVFSYIDEIIAGTLFIYFLIKKENNKEFFIFILIFFFYLIYSFYIQSNVYVAIWTDFFIQMKPFVAFYCAYSVNLSLNNKNKHCIKYVCILLSIFLLIIGIAGIYSIEELMGHPSRYATALVILGILYFYCSARKKKDIYIMFIILAVGLLSLRSKIFGLYAVALLIFYFIKNQKLKFSIRTLLLVSISTAIVVFFAWEKISFYFITGTEAKNMFARPLLYQNAYFILNDYFPFGSGLGSYATYASSVYYSPIYYKYGLVYSPEIGNGHFISDTFYPALAQFGYIGVGLFLWFWYRIYKKTVLMYDITHDINNYKICLVIIMFFLIESVADSTFTHNRGMMMLMLLAMFLNEKKPNNNTQ